MSRDKKNIFFLLKGLNDEKGRQNEGDCCCNEDEGAFEGISFCHAPNENPNWRKVNSLGNMIAMKSKLNFFNALAFCVALCLFYSSSFATVIATPQNPGLPKISVDVMPLIS